MEEFNVPKSGNRPLITACIIARDEEEFLPGCLESGKGFWDEIVLIDTGSVDRTIEIAKAYGASVYSLPWDDDFATSRNQAFEKARGIFCHCIDADERIVDTDLAETRYYLEHQNLPNILLVREVLLYPGGREIVVLAPRIVRRDSGIRYVFPVHEQLNVEDEEAMLSNIHIRHLGYASEHGLRKKEERNLRIAKKMDPAEPHALHCRARAAMALADWDEMFEASRALVEKNASPILTIEGCVLGGAAAYNLRRLDDLEYFAEIGRKIAPESPDIRYVELLASARKYIEALRRGDSATPGDFVRPWMFWHDLASMETLLEVLVGKRRILPGSSEEIGCDINTGPVHDGDTSGAQ